MIPTVALSLAVLSGPTAPEPKSLTASLNASLKPQLNADQRFGLGGTVGGYMPTGNKLQDAFGKNRFVVGFRPVGLEDIPSGWIRTPSFEAISARRGDNRLFIVPITLGFARIFGDSSKDWRPFLRAGAGVAYMDYAFDDENDDRVSGKRFGPTANIEFGIRFKDILRISATYHVFEKYDKTQFDGLELTATYTLFRF